MKDKSDRQEKRLHPGRSTSDENQHGADGELLLELLDRIRALEDKEKEQSLQVKELQCHLDQSQSEVYALNKKVRDLQTAL